MRLKAGEKLCLACQEKNCLLYCPQGCREPAVFNCRHCRLETAPCTLACKNNAFFEVAEGIISIDKEKCDGCGACLQACPEKAIQVQAGKAVKCDLCAANNFFLACLKACPEKALTLEKTAEEIKATEKILGWRVFRFKESEIQKVLLEKESFAVVEDRQGQRHYLIKNLPELSPAEARLVDRVLEAIRAEPNQKTVKPEFVRQVMKAFLLDNSIELDKEQFSYLCHVIESLAFRFGVLSELLANDSLEEIAVIGLGQEKPVYVFHQAFGWLPCNAYFCQEKSVRNLANKMAREMGRRLSTQTPRLNAVLNDGSRLNALISPVSFSGPSLTIRKFRAKPFRPIDLLKLKTISSEALAFLWLLLQTDASMIIAGNTGSGKTTSLNALFSFVPLDERIVVTEETPEISLPHQHVIKLSVAEESGVKMDDLIVESLRMRPDRVVVGEIRNKEEVSAFIDTMLAGQGRGSYATLHALTAAEALKRLRNLGAMEMDLSALDLIIVQKRWTAIGAKGNRKELRKIIEIAEVDSKAGLNVLWQYSFKKKKLERKNQSVKAWQKLLNTFYLTEKGLKKEWKRRSHLLSQEANN